MERGRPTKLTDEVKAKIVQAISQGNYYEAACSYAAISYQTLRNWKEQGESDGNGEYFDFFESIKKAEAQAELRLVQEWQKHIPNNWQAIATFLERRYPDRWSKRERVALEHSGGIKYEYVAEWGNETKD